MSYAKASLLFLYLGNMLAMESLFDLVKQDDVPGVIVRLKDVLNAAELKDHEFNTLLHHAQSEPMVACLIKARIPVNVKNAESETPLHWVLRTHPVPDSAWPVVTALLDAGADIASVNEKRQTPVHNIVAHNFEYLIKFFSQVPRCVISEVTNRYRKSVIQTFLLSCYRFKTDRNLIIPKDMRRLITQFISYPPFYWCNEQDEVKKITSDKIALVKHVLEIEDLDKRTPADLELYIWPEDKSELLNADRPEQYGGAILESIARQVTLKNRYVYDLYGKLIRIVTPETNP